MLSVAFAILVMTLLLIYRVPRIASYAGLGLAWYSVPTARMVRWLVTLLLLGSLGATWLVRVRLRHDQAGSARIWMAMTLGLALVAFGAGVWECRTYVNSGLTLARYRTRVFDSADLNYLRAVRQRLKELDSAANSGLDSLDTGQDVSGGSKPPLAEQLQRHLVTWTEHQVGLWESDLDRRRADLMLFAYEIQPRAGGRAAAETQYRAEQVSIRQELEFLPVLRDYCRARLAELGQPATAQGGAPTGRSVTQLQRELDRFSEDATAEQKRMMRWATAGDATVQTVARQLRMAELRLKELDGRSAFAGEFLDALFSNADLEGLNARYPQLDLPIQLPDIRDTAHTLILVRWILLGWMLAGLFVLAWPPAWRRGGADTRSRLAAITFWQVLASVGVFAFIILG